MHSLWDIGNLEAVFLNADNNCRMYFCCGLRLSPLLNDVQQFYHLLKDYDQDAVLRTSSPLLQVVNNLAGNSECTTDLTGTFMKEGEHYSWATNNRNYTVLNNLHFCKTLLGLYFDDYHVVADYVGKISR